MPLDPPAQEDPPLPPSGSRRALIMEHEKAIVEILAEVLAGEGVKALGAPDMKNATMMLAAAVDRAESIDLIVANNVHGGAHCEPLLDWIRASTLVYGDGRLLRETPVIAMGVEGDPFEDDPSVEYLQKPFRLADFVNAVRQAIGRED